MYQDKAPSELINKYIQIVVLVSFVCLLDYINNGVGRNLSE